MDTGILAPPKGRVDISQKEVANRAGTPLEEALARGDKRECTEIMCQGAASLAKELYDQGRILGVIGIGGAQGTEIASAAMRALPTGVPRFNGLNGGQRSASVRVLCGHQGPDHHAHGFRSSGLNFLSKQILQNAAGPFAAWSSILKALLEPEGIPVAMSMLGTTTPGALRAKKFWKSNGYEVVTFHQNGTGGIAMEDMISEGVFRGVLDLNLHEIGDRYVGGLHGAIRADRLTAAGAMGVPQIVAPGSGNYTVQGSPESLTDDMRRRKHFNYNPHLTLVRLKPEELIEVAKEIAEKLNRAKGPVKVFIPLEGFSFPDREGLPHWEPEGNQVFIDALKKHLADSIPLFELDAHINDEDFIDPVINEFMVMMAAHYKSG